ncbi:MULTISPECIES: site-specific DNA-methyltransferase [unclassified Anaerobiospirillum]|uniref:site-specific DNA-methyltransferase n=1 Tax=unclassified Anaerobiospirillum TaxID=2647410 RepID=UPI001FF43C89|nr:MULTISPECIES: site-specific DNA-methyltransferase [unclassified Anaerobiospirillum]MCK0533652.1 site-specific DNA-methyltransferase [Anaerobiospirillum sp. NML120511]MCK0539616.1 site-specific DNA-methyltransferase [Anaerobiospirillum sp. NML02-A-032]
MDKLSMQSVDGVAANIDIIARFFPSCITEARDPEGQLVRGIDFEKLKAELSSSCIPDKAERYQFTWPGKMDAARLANQPSAATLRPCREESVDFDTTSNLYIEGDNLEVLKVLRNTYAGKVKMIYIDPPYNTGKDFLYEDNFSMDRKDFLIQSGQLGADGKRRVVNSDANGRFHTSWLNMIYPRLKLARELLTEDGIMFISIDDNESDNLSRLCAEVFGEGNIVSRLIWKKKQGGGNDSDNVVVEHEYILVVARNIECVKLFPVKTSQLDIKKYPEKDEYGHYGLITLDKTSISGGPTLIFDITGPDGRVYSPRTVKGKQAYWRWSKEKVEADYDLLVFKDGKVYTKNYYSEEGAVQRSLLIGEEYGRTNHGGKDISDLFGFKPFSYPKPVKLIEHLLALSCREGIVLDFFSGSATTAHAVMKVNARCGSKLSFIMVQIPEAVVPEKDDAKKAYEAGFKNICEIGKERIRRAGAAIRAESGLMAGDLDTGFRVLKLDSSNMKDVYYSADEVSLNGFSEFNIKEGRSGEDLLFQVMLDLGIELSSSIELRSLAGHTVYVVNDGYLAACFDDRVSMDATRAIAGLKPYWFVMCDAAFGSDADADNIMQVFSGLSRATQIKVI